MNNPTNPPHARDRRWVTARLVTDGVLVHEVGPLIALSNGDDVVHVPVSQVTRLIDDIREACIIDTSPEPNDVFDDMDKVEDTIRTVGNLPIDDILEAARRRGMDGREFAARWTKYDHLFRENS